MPALAPSFGRKTCLCLEQADFSTLKSATVHGEAPCFIIVVALSAESISRCSSGDEYQSSMRISMKLDTNSLQDAINDEVDDSL